MPIDIEDLEPRAKAPEPKKLDDMSIEELQGYVAELEAEIARVKAEIATKERYMSGAESAFKKA